LLLEQRSRNKRDLYRFILFATGGFWELPRMLAKIYSGAVFGVDAYEVEIEVNASSGAPVIVVVGLPDVAVKESRDRVTTAVSNSGFRWPKGRTTINLAPADVKKEGPSFDLPIALGMIACAEERELPHVNEFCFLGELALTGAVRRCAESCPWR
jgi:magnesium chelatase family protein